MSKRRRNRDAAGATEATAPTARVSAGAPAGSVDWERMLLAVLLFVPMLVSAFRLLPELTSPVPASNDLALHWQMVLGASREMAAWRNPLDFWMPQIELGYPQFLYYQNLPHLFVAGLHRLLFGLVELRTVFDGVRFLLLVCLPLTVYWSMRRMEFSARAATISAAASMLFANRSGFGLAFDGQLWIGRGLFTQLWAEHLSLIAMAGLYRLMRSGRGYTGTILALTALALSHFIWSYMMAMTGVMLWLLLSTRENWLANAVRLGTVGLLAIAMASYMLVPFATSASTYLAMYPGVESPNARQLGPMMRWLSGRLMDEGRLPVLTVLTVFGAVAAMRLRTRATRVALVGTVAWLILYQIRPTEVNALGRFLRYDGHLVFRFVGILDVFSMLLIGVAGEWIWRAIADRRTGRVLEGEATATPRSVGGSVLAFVAVVVILAPALVDRFAFFGLDGNAIRATEAALVADPELTAVIDTMASQPGGRAYMGLASNGGKEWRVGPLIRAYDVLKFRGQPAIAPSYQGLSLNADFVEGFRDRDPAQWDLLDVRYLALPGAAPVEPFMTPFFRTSRYAVYRVPTTGIATYGGIVERRRAGSQLELLTGADAWSKSAAPAAKQFIRWDYRQKAGTLNATAPCPGGGRTLSERAEAGIIDLEVECPAASSLILKTTFHPNWRVTVDGQPVRSYMVSPAFIGIDLPAGKHVVAARYTMATDKWILLGFGAIVLVIVLVLRDRLDWLPSRLVTAARPS